MIDDDVRALRTVCENFPAWHLSPPDATALRHVLALTLASMTQPMTQPLPLPCPFCGARALVEHITRGGTARIEVGCFSASCPVIPSILGDSRDATILRWNTRPPPQKEQTT
jgi:hypothetical protein